MTAAAAGALRAADAGTRMGVRRHPVVPAVILSDLAVRAVEITAVVNRGRSGDLDRPLIWDLAGDLGRDLDHARSLPGMRTCAIATARP